MMDMMENRGRNEQRDSEMTMMEFVVKRQNQNDQKAKQLNEDRINQQTNQPTMIGNDHIQNGTKTWKSERKQEKWWTEMKNRRKWMEMTEIDEFREIIWNYNRLRWTHRKWDRNTQIPKKTQ